MKCKICDLENSHPEAFESINGALKRSLKMLSFTKELNQLYSLNITPNNVSRHKSHYLRIKSTHVIEVKEEDINKNSQNVGKSRRKTNKTSTNPANFFTSPELSPKYEKFLLIYRNNGYSQKEKSWKEAGFKRAEGVYDVLKRPEVAEALHEMKAIDFNKLRVTGNQVIAGLGKIAHAAELRHLMYDEDGNLIPNINEWPEELRIAITSVKQKITISRDSEGGETEKKEYEFKFESQLGAFKELRKHFMEIELYKDKNPDKEHYEKIIEMLLENKLNPITAGLELGKLNLSPPEALKIAMRKVDPSILDKPVILDDMNLDDLTDEELDRLEIENNS